MTEDGDYIEWRKDEPTNKVWWGDIYHGITPDDVKSGNVTPGQIQDSIGWGDSIFSFDKKKVFWLFRDYPYALTDQEKTIFDKENPFWVEFFKDRQ